MKTIARDFFIVGVALFSCLASASSLEDLIVSAWKSDPFIHSQESRIKAAELDKFARFLPNNPNISFIDQDNSSWKTYGVSLQLGLPGKAFAFHHVDNEVLKAEQSEMTAKKIELASFVVDRYSSCASNKALVEILRVAVDELDTLRETITARYEMGQSTQAERIGIELQYRQANIEYNTFKDQLKVACQKFTEYLEERKLDVSLVDKIELTEDLNEELLSELGSKGLGIIRSENEMRVSEAEYKVSFWKVMPDLTLYYYRNYYNKVVASPIVPIQWTTSYGVMINIPLLFPYYERAEYLKEKSSHMINARRAYMRRIESERTADDAANSFRRNKQILKKLQDHDLPMAETMLDSTLAAYKQGKLGFSELILAKRTWLDLRKEEVNLKYDLVNARLICLNACERK